MKDEISISYIGVINVHENMKECSISEFIERSDLDVSAEEFIGALSQYGSYNLYEIENEIYHNAFMTYAEDSAIGEDPECESYNITLDANGKDGTICYDVVSDLKLSGEITITKDMTGEEFIEMIDDYKGENANIGYLNIYPEKMEYPNLKNKEDSLYDDNEHCFLLGDESEIEQDFEKFKEQLFQGIEVKEQTKGRV